jgi:Predicted RNA-binding protein of the translin family
MDRAAEIASVRENARTVLDAKHHAREITLGACRLAIQSCAAAIRAVQREEFARAEELIAEADAHLTRADDAVRAHPDVRHGGYLHDAKKEFAEAHVTLAFVRGDVLPSAADIGVDIPAYLNGMAEAASELRRHILDCLRADRLARAEELLAVMDEVYALLVTVDYPDAITGGLRRTTDALRAVIERTRGDLTNALVAQRLRVAIEESRTSPTE